MIKNTIITVFILLMGLSFGCSVKRPAPSPSPTAKESRGKSTPAVTETPQAQKTEPHEPPPTTAPISTPEKTGETDKKDESIKKVNENLEKGDYRQAMKTLDKVIREDPKNADALAIKGRAFIEMHDYEKARDFINKALEIDPNNEKACFYMGILKQMTFDDTAVDDFNRAIELNPGNTEAYFRRGEAWMDRSDINKARSDFEKVVEMDPGSMTGKLAAEKLKEIRNKDIKTKDNSGRNDIEDTPADAPEKNEKLRDDSRLPVH